MSATGGVIIAAPASGSGKTVFTLGLLRHLVRSSVKVASAKAGPDYIDPAFHAAATGRPCLNLDIWAMRPATLAAAVGSLSLDADLVVCISEATRRDFVAWAAARGGARGTVATLRLGDDRPATPPAAPPPELADLVPGRFVLAVSTIQVRKNYDLLYALWRRLRERDTPDLPVLVIAGRRGWLASDLLTLIEKDKLTEGHIRICDDPDDTALAWLYANCRFTLYPSLYEGWGLPIAESLAYGKACIASETSSMPEVGRGLALHLDPLDFMAWQREIERLIADDARLAALEARIRAGFRPHSWAASGAELLALVDATAAGPAQAAGARARAGE